jgi:stearoyl-CoA desaturase (Delta-9 desaturase)
MASDELSRRPISASDNWRKREVIAGAARLDRRLAVAVTVLPTAGTLLALALWLAGHGPGPAEIVVFVVLYLATALGLEVGFHRHVTHKAFKADERVRMLLIALGSMAAHGPVIWWAAVHRRHHATSDTPDDPHSPNLTGRGIGARLAGLYHSHMGWLFEAGSTRPPGWQQYVQDLYKDGTVLRLHMQYYAWVAIGLLAPTLFCGLVTRSWFGALSGFLWGGLVRSFAVSHCIWSLNSFCHVVGSRYFDSGEGDRSKNSFILALFTFGQGWHNNHHAFPSSAYTGLTWWQIDFGGQFVGLLKASGLAWDVRRPSVEAIDRKRAAAISPMV